MAANFLGLFLLILAGISNVLSVLVPGKNFRDTYNPWLDYRNIKSPYVNSYQNYLRSFRDDWYRKSRDRFRNVDVVDYFDDNIVDHFENIRTTTPSDKFRNPTTPDVFSQSNIRSISPEVVNFASDLYVTGQKFSNFKETPEPSKDIPDTEITSNSVISQTVYKIPSKRQHESISLLKTEDVNLINDKSSFVPLENSRKGGPIETSMENKEFRGTSEFLTDTFTKREGTDSSFIDKRKDRIEGVTFPKGDSVTPILETKEKCGCKYLCTKIISLQELFKKTNKADVQTESTTMQKSSSVITPEVAPLFSDSTKSTNNQKSDMFTNEGKFQSKSTRFEDPNSIITREVIPLGAKSSSSVNTETTYSKDSKIETAATQSSSLTTDGDIHLKIKSSSLEGIHSTNTQNFGTETIFSQPSSTVTSDDTTLQSRLSSFEAKPTTSEISEIESTTENFISTSKDASVSFSDKVTEDVRKETFHPESSSSEVQFTSGNVKQNHVIEISSIHTARIVITSLFLVIALTALTVLAVYMFTLRRKTVHYDQLQLIS